jgi:hypothetical protein
MSPNLSTGKPQAQSHIPAYRASGLGEACSEATGERPSEAGSETRSETDVEARW